VAGAEGSPVVEAEGAAAEAGNFDHRHCVIDEGIMSNTTRTKGAIQGFKDWLDIRKRGTVSEAARTTLIDCLDQLALAMQKPYHTVGRLVSAREQEVSTVTTTLATDVNNRTVVYCRASEATASTIEAYMVRAWRLLELEQRKRTSGYADLSAAWEDEPVYGFWQPIHSLMAKSGIAFKSDTPMGAAWLTADPLFDLMCWSFLIGEEAQMLAVVELLNLTWISDYWLIGFTNRNQPIIFLAD
jgi:hypothetical protein